MQPSIHLKQHVLELRLYFCLCQQILGGLFDSNFQHYLSACAEHWGAEALDHFYSVCLTPLLPWAMEKKEKDGINIALLWLDDTITVL